jgi:TonB family protein
MSARPLNRVTSESKNTSDNYLARSKAENLYVRGFVSSLLLHAFFFGGILLKGSFKPPVNPEIIYSVSIEGGPKLGGISQLDDGKKTNVAPPKRVSKEEKEPVSEVLKKEEVKVKEAVVTPKPEEKVKENVVKEKEEVVPTPKLKVQPTSKATTPPVVSTVKPKGTKKPANTPVTKPPNLDEEYQKAMQKYTGESTAGRGSGFGSGKLGGKGMGGGEVRPQEFFRYRDLLMNTVRSGWRWYGGGGRLIATVSMRISKEGVISNERVIVSSGDRSFDESVLRAIRRADPLPPPPPNVYVDFAETNFVFDPN